jgi:TonB-dependent SusC/RagA subfamily outer membrane receptor
MNVKKKSVPEILSELFDGTDVRYIVEGVNIVLVKLPPAATQPAAVQQNGRKVSGTVVDAVGEPVVGANVLEKGSTTNGTVTDVEGNFSLTVAESAVLQVSFIGYITQEIPVGNRNSLNVILKENIAALDEVIVIGYGTAKRKDVTGSVVRADLSKLQESPNVSIGQSLQGTIPGLNVGAVNKAGSDPDITVRGRNSISGSTSPLIVLDGIVYRGSLVDLNPSDIESIDVLKDASAAAIYGSQASNGVLLVTSKTVKAMSKPIIEYSGTYSIQEATTGKLKPLDREGYLQWIANCYLEDSRTGPDLLQPNPSWDISKVLPSAAQVNGYLNGTYTDWWDMETNDYPYISSHNLSVRGRSELSN